MRHSVPVFVLAALASAASAFNASAANAPVTAEPPMEKVDLELVIATDTSPSIDTQEARLQRQGIATAFRSPEIIRAIQNGSLGKIAVAYIDWSSAPFNRLVLDWRVVKDKASAEDVAATLLKVPLTYGNGTSVSGALQIAARMMETNRLEGTRRTIDISGDGPNNRGMTVIDARDDIVARGITINGLPIITYEYGVGDWGAYYLEIDKYYANCVIGGRGSFSLPAQGFQDFANAVRRKLVLEISEDAPLKPTELPRIIRTALAPRTQAPNPLRPAPTARVPRENCVSGFQDF